MSFHFFLIVLGLFCFFHAVRCAFLASLSAYAAALFVVAVFCYFFKDLLVFFRAQSSRLQFFLLGLVPQLCRVFSLYSGNGCSFQAW